MKKDTFGINMRKWCSEHELEVNASLSDGNVTEELLDDHERKLEWLQHERLVHLIVTVMTVFGEIFVVDLVLLHPDLGIGPAVIMLGLAVLLGFYARHYFFLENTVQRWYVLYDKMKSVIQNKK